MFFCINTVRARCFTFLTVQSIQICQNSFCISVPEAAYRSGKDRIRLTVDLALVIRCHGQRCFCNGKDAGFYRNIIVSKIFPVDYYRCQNIVSGMFTGASGYGTFCDAFIVSVLQAFQRYDIIRRIFISVYLACIFRSHCQRRFRDSHHTVLIFHGIIALLFLTGQHDRIGRDILAGSSFCLIKDHRRIFSELKTADHSCPFRIFFAIDFRLVIRFDDDRCTSDLELSRFIRHVVIALYVFSGRSDHVCSDILAFFTAYRIGDHIFIIHKALHSCCKLRVFLSVDLGTENGLHGQLRPLDRECSRFIAHSIIALLFFTGYNDLVLACISTFLTEDGEFQIFCGISCRQPFDMGCQDRIFFSIRSGPVICCDDDRFSCDLYRSVFVKNDVVALISFAGSDDRILSDILSVLSVQCIPENRFVISVPEAGHFCGQNRIRLSVDLLLSDSRYDNLCRCDVKNAAFIVNGVVPLTHISCKEYRIDAGILSACAAERIMKQFFRIFSVLHTGHLGGKDRILISVGFPLFHDMHCYRSGCDGKAAVHKGHIIIALFGFSGRNDRVGTHILAFLAAERIYDHRIIISGDKAFGNRCQSRVRISVDFCLRQSGYSHRTSVDRKETGLIGQDIIPLCLFT